MATWNRSERVTRTVEYTVPASEPWGADWNQVQQALSCAIVDHNRANDRDPETPPADDAIHVHVMDECIVISFTKKGGE